MMPYKCESMFISRHTCVYVTSFTSNKQKFFEMGTYKCNSSFELGNILICIASKLLQCFASHASFAVLSEPILQFLIACRLLNFKQDQSVDGAIDVFIRVVLEKLVGGYVTMEQRRIIGELLLQVVSNVPWINDGLVVVDNDGNCWSFVTLTTWWWDILYYTSEMCMYLRDCRNYSFNVVEINPFCFIRDILNVCNIV